MLDGSLFKIYMRDHLGHNGIKFLIVQLKYKYHS